MVKVRGTSRLNAKLKRLRTETAEAVKPGIARAAEIVTAEQRRLVPVRTGALRDSIQWTFGDPPAYASVGFKRGTRKENETRATITAGNTDVRYAHIVEFGSKSVNAQPFFYTGYRASVKAARRAIAAEVRKNVKRAAR